MAVYTEVAFGDAAALVERLGLGVLTDLKGIKGGIENTNYFITCEHENASHEHVLTIFERLSFEQLPFYLRLMKHLAGKGIPVPEPVIDEAGEVVHRLHDKPAAIVNKLAGRNQLAPEAAHCAAVGEMLARMHLAGRDFSMGQPNLRGLQWWNETVPVVLPHLSDSQACLIEGELAYQNHVASSTAYAALPRGPVHADLFRDNVMFEGDKLCGFFDFYFAGVDTFLFDIAVCLNDWCIRHEPDNHAGADGERQLPLYEAFLSAYESVRPLEAAERALLPAMERAAALRFWISRLWDWHLPRDASMLEPHDPRHFEYVIRQCLSRLGALPVVSEAAA
ncbi:homoserine kinase [Hydrogenophaga sp. 5NK40-0174]|uniref:homoserine kinase n=1 Tax=Hydrogenophaga sp. 5NK40-0174 TaxID=3127649 RepID=UPI0031025018